MEANQILSAPEANLDTTSDDMSGVKHIMILLTLKHGTFNFWHNALKALKQDWTNFTNDFDPAN